MGIVPVVETTLTVANVLVASVALVAVAGERLGFGLTGGHAGLVLGPSLASQFPVL